MIQPGNGRSIVWLASYPRSGNTWTRIFIHNLLNVLAGKDEPADINDLERFSTWESYKKHYHRVLGEGAKLDDWRVVAAARPRVQAALAARTRGIVFVKTHLAIINVAGAPAINPDVTAGGIYIVRNPLDVAVSFAKHINRTVDQVIEIMGRRGHYDGQSEAHVYEVMESWSENVAGWTRHEHDTLLVLRYEDIFADPVEVFGKVARHVGLLPTRAHLEKAVRFSEISQLQKQEQSKLFVFRAAHSVEPFFRKGGSGGWRDALSPAQIRRIVDDHSAMMSRFGYLDDATAHLEAVKD